MEQGKNSRKERRATFSEVFRSIKFSGKRSRSADGQWPEPGFAVNRSVHVGVAALDDYQQLVRSGN